MKNDGGPAFPLDSVRPNFVISNVGMSLRDWFAGMAMQGILAANPPALEKTAEVMAKELTAVSYFIADFMIEEREGKI